MASVTTATLRRRMAERGLTVNDLVAEAGMYPNDVSNVLRGVLPIGPTRRSKLEHAIARLQLDRDLPVEPKPDRGPVFQTS